MEFLKLILILKGVLEKNERRIISSSDGTARSAGFVLSDALVAVCAGVLVVVA